MTNQELKSEIDKALSIKDFNRIQAIFEESQDSFKGLIVFYKQQNSSKVPSQNQLFNQAEFWRSKLPHFYLEKILQSDIKISFFQSYFNRSGNQNPELDKHLVLVAKEDFIKQFKLWRAYQFPKFISSITELSAIDADIKRLNQEINHVIKAEKALEGEELKDRSFFLQYNIGEILLGFALYHYEFKQQASVAGNKSYQTQIEVATVNSLNTVLGYFTEPGNFKIDFENNIDLQSNFRRNEAAHHTLGKKSEGTLESKYQLLFSLINRMIERQGREGEIQLYLCGYAQFESVVLPTPPLKTNNSFREFRVNNSKSSPEELYFSELSLDSIGKNIPSRVVVTSELRYLKFNGISETITAKGKSIDLRKVFILLKHFAVFKGTVERTFINSEKFLVMNQGSKAFIELFGGNESITLFNYDDLLQGIKKYFNWSIEDATATLSFLTYELQSPDKPLTWLQRPFLKLNGKVIWIGTLLKDRRWCNIIFNKIRSEQEYKSLINTFTSNFEINIENIFKAAQFTTLSREKFKCLDGQTGDFDVLAFKENILFVCEAKTGARSDDFSHAAHSETVKLEGCAAEQLEKAIMKITEDWSEIKSKLNIKPDTLFNEVKIVPLIITDFFEGDMRLYKSKIRKISLLELEVILKNNKKKLLEMYLIHQRFINGLNPELNKSGNLIENWDLWNSQSECTGELILKNIDGNFIWKEIETTWQFEDSQFFLM